MKRSFHESQNWYFAGAIDDFTSKVIFFFAFFATMDQFWCQIINWLMRNITFATREINASCSEAKQKIWKKSTVHELNRNLDMCPLMKHKT